MNAFRLFIATFWMLLFFGGAAHAGPLGIAIGAFGTFLASGTIIANLVGALILSAVKFGISLLTRAKNNDIPPGIKTQIQVGGNNPISFLVGYRATAGQLEYVNTWGHVDKTPNAYVVQVISLSDIPITALKSRVWIMGELCEIDFGSPDAGGKGYPVTQFLKDGKHHLWIKFYDGTQTVADPYLVSVFSADPDRPWKTSMVGRGIAYAIVTTLFERSLFNGIPSLRFECDGIKLYSPAKDSTNGGSGACRWNDQSTWAFEDDNATIIYNLTRGIYYNGQWLYGGQNLPATLLPPSTWIAGRNECKVAIPLLGGGSEPQFRCGYEISVNNEPLAMIDKFLSGCNGRMAEIGGFYKIRVGAPGPSVYSFTDADIVATEDMDFDPFPGLEMTYNGANARYTEPGEAWELKDAPPYYSAAYEAEDGGRRLIASLTLDTTSSNTQVQRLVKAAVEANRRFRRVVVALPPETWMLEPGIDTIDWTSTREGYVAKDFIITGMTGRRGMIQFLQILEIDPTDYNWTPGSDQKPFTINYLGSVRPGPQSMVGWQAFPVTLVDNFGIGRRPGIGVSYPGDLTDVQSVQIQVRLKNTLSNVFDGNAPYGNPATNANPSVRNLNATFLPNNDYQVRGKPIPFSGRDTNWTEWLDVKTDDIRLGSEDFYPISLSQLAQDVAAFQKWMADSVRDVLDELRAVSADSAANSMVGFSDKQTVRRQLTSTAEKITAGYTEAITVATGPGSALAQRIETVEVAIPGLATVAVTDLLSAKITVTDGRVDASALAITALQTTVNDPVSGVAVTATAVTQLSTRVTTTEQGIEANSQAIVAVETAMDGMSANGTFRILTGYSPSSGWTAKIGFQTRVDAGSVFRTAGLYLESTASNARIVMDSDLLAIVTGGVLTALFDAGTAYIANARIRNLTAGNIVAKSLDANVVMQNGTIITDLIAFDTIMASAVDTTAGTPHPTDWWSAFSIVCANPNPTAVQLFTKGSLSINKTSGSSSCYVRLLRNGSELFQVLIGTAGGGPKVFDFDEMFVDTGAPQGTSTYDLQILANTSGGAGATVSGLLVGNWGKR